MKGKKILIIVIIIIITISGSVYYFKSKKSKVEYTTAEAQHGNLYQTVSVTGKIVPENQVKLAFKSSGRILFLGVEIGDKVIKGQKIATIDSGTLMEQIRSAEAEIKVQKETLDNMKKRDDTYNGDQRNAQRAIIKKAEESHNALLVLLRDLSIYSPMDGIVVEKNIEKGEIAVANSVVITIAEEGKLKVESNVPESDIIKIALGQKAEMTLDAFSSEDIFASEVTEIEPAATVIQDVVYYKIKLKLSDEDTAKFKSGMSVDLDINTAEKDNIIFIPERAVKNDEGKKYVEILKDEEKSIIDKIYVQTGMRGDDGMIEIMSGLSGGENVITLSKTQ